MVRERPLICSTDMVKSILALIKTMTRRMQGLDHINEQPDRWEYIGQLCYHGDRAIAGFKDLQSRVKKIKDVFCPYGKPGDIMWVREAWSKPVYFNGLQENCHAVFKTQFDGPVAWNWKPSIHMPKAAARIWLEITDIRVERLQSITERDAIAEGVERIDGEFKDYTGLVHSGRLPAAYWSFNSLWCKINGEDSWDLNPWVWVISFKVLSTTGKPDSIPFNKKNNYAKSKN